MPYDKLVDSAQLDNAITQTANAIRAKTGSADLIEWNTDTGFADAVGSLGGASGGNISYQSGYRINSSGEQIAYDGYATSDYISCELNNVVYLLNIYMESGVENAGNLRIAFYDNDKVHLGQTNATGAGDNLSGKYEATDGSLSQFTVKSFTDCDLTNVKYIRLCSTKLDGDSVVIVTESSGGSGGSGDDNINIVHKKDVNFYDYDGTLLHSYTIDEVKHLTKLPELPEQKGLICQGWNWSLNDIKAHNRAVDVGATYITDDGKTRIYVTLPEGMTSPKLWFALNGTVTVDWGDGDELDTFTGTSTSKMMMTANHNYAKPGDYVITLTTVGNLEFRGSGNGSNILSYSENNNDKKNAYALFIRKIEIGENLTQIGSNAFGHCYSLEHVTIPNGVTSISSYAFYYCHSLKHVTIPNGVTIIPNCIFDQCYSLERVTIPNSVTTIGEKAFMQCKNIVDISIPNSVTVLGVNAFGGCESLTSTVIPDGVTILNNYTFQANYTITSIVIPSGVTSIENNAFANCRSLRSIVIPDNVASIGSSAFSGCYSLMTAIFPNSLRSIGNTAFASCKCVYYFDFSRHTTIPSISSTTVFDSISAECEIRVPAALYDEWIAATNWSTYASQIVAV